LADNDYLLTETGTYGIVASQIFDVFIFGLLLYVIFRKLV